MNMHTSSFRHMLFVIILLTFLLICKYVFYSRNIIRPVKKNLHAPTNVLQFGMPRTATTLQFQIICILMSFSYEHDIYNVGCSFNKIPSNKYYALKIHHSRKFPKQIPSDMLVFMTDSKSLTIIERKKLKAFKDMLKTKGINIPLIVDIETAMNRSYNVVYDYQQFFNVSDIQMKHALEYIRYWDIIRLCCGKQMSESWRKYLSTNDTTAYEYVKNSSTVQFCLKYDISEIEQNLMRTYVYRHFSQKPSLRYIIGRPSNVDGDLDGTYCARCNRNIKGKKNIRFNQDCV